MAFVTPKNLFSPITNKTFLFLLIFFAILFAIVRQSGGKITVQNVQTVQTVPQAKPIAVPQQATVPNPRAKNDSFLPFGFNELNKEDTAQKPTSSSKENLDDILKQLN